MPRTGKGTRTRRTMAAHAQTRAVNTELREAHARFGADSAPERASERVYRITGHRIPSGAVFSAMGIRPVEGMASRGQWLTQRAMSESVATSTETQDDRRARAIAARERRAAPPTIRAMGKVARSTEKRVEVIYRDLAQWAAWDEIIFAHMYDALLARWVATEDEKRLNRDLRQLQLRREASRYWEDHMLACAQSGQVTVAQLRAEIKARHKNDVVNGRAPVTVADCPFWESRTPEPVKVTPVARPVVFLSAEVEAPTVDSKYFTRGTD